MKEGVILLVKNMVCARCISTVENIMEELAIPFRNITLGEIFLDGPLSAEKLLLLQDRLNAVGFELIERRVNKIVEDIKLAVAHYLNDLNDNKINLSAFITATILYDYSYLSDLFSGIEGRSIEQYFIDLRIEKVKELIVYDQLSFTEIAFRTGFSSVHHLSAQFKKVTGLTPSRFKNIRDISRKPLDKI